MSEEITKGLVKKRLIDVGYPINQDENVNGIICYKEDSYNNGLNMDKKLAVAFLNASKRNSGNKGTPDYIIKSDKSNLVIVIECKSNVDYHQTYDDLNKYKQNLGNSKEICEYCINGALHYATYLNHDYDVIAIATSGVTENNYRCTSFYLPKNGKLSNLILLEDGDYQNTIMKIDSYQEIIDEKTGKNQEEIERLTLELQSYANACNNYLRTNHISAKDRAGFISALVLALTDEESALYTLTVASFGSPEQKIPFKDKLGKNAIIELKKALNDIWVNKDKFPEIKRKKLEEYYDRILTSQLLEKPESSPKFFKNGDNILSSCIFSAYENIVLKIKTRTSVDVMGTFYTVFLKYASGDAQDKGIVLTPKHITELFCDIAEYYLGRKLDDTTKVLDCCCGTGGFLIGALNRMDFNINQLQISNDLKKERKEIVRKNCLIGIEREPEMFALAYANMRFHGDGKSKLYCCSSLIKDKGIARVNEFNENITLQEELNSIEDGPIIGMINPPYSMRTEVSDEKKGEKQKGQSELDFVYSMLNYLKKGGIGIAIVPISCASNKGEKLRKTILKEHSLLACMTMPVNLFQNSGVSIPTCIMVFKAHIKHENSAKNVFLSRWLDDGFVTIVHSGRTDRNGNWLAKKSEWLRELKGLSKPKNTEFLMQEINVDDEALAEAYIETDYSILTKKNFENILKRYSLFKYSYLHNQKLITVEETLYWLLDNLNDFEKTCKGCCDSKYSNLEFDVEEWKEFKYSDIFEICKGYYNKKPDHYNEGNIRFLGATKNNNGVTEFYTYDEIDLFHKDGSKKPDEITKKIFKGNCIAVTNNGSVGNAYYQSEQFTCSHDVNPLYLKNYNLNKYIAMFLCTIIETEKFRWSFGRKWRPNKMPNSVMKLPVKKDKLGNFILDETGNYIPDYEFMEKYIKGIEFSNFI